MHKGKDYELFLQELTELSKKHSLYLRGRHEDDWWYAPFISIKSTVEGKEQHIAESVCWDENEQRYTAKPDDYWND